MSKRGGKAAEPTLSSVKGEVLKKIQASRSPAVIDKLADAYESLSRAEQNEVGTLREMLYLEEVRAAAQQRANTTAAPMGTITGNTSTW
jgi:hypothetical protein